QPLGQPVLADHALGPRPALRRELDDAAVEAQIPLIPQAPDHLGHRRRRMPEPFDQAGLYHTAALLAQLEDRFEILLERRVDALGHGSSVPRSLRGRPGFGVRSGCLEVAICLDFSVTRYIVF